MGRPRKTIDAEGGLATIVDIMEDDGEGNPFAISGVDISKFNLSQFQVKFIIEYMNNGMNSMAAAKTVFGLKTNDAAKKKAAYVMSATKVYNVLQLLLRRSVNKSLQFSPALLMSHIETWLNYDIRNYYDSSGKAIELDDIPEDSRQLISGVEYTINNRTGERYVTYRLPDKYKALQELSSIVKFLQSIEASSNNIEDDDAKSKRDEIFGKVTNYEPAEAEIVPPESSEEQPEEQNG